jgi:hypothetical protein
MASSISNDNCINTGRMASDRIAPSAFTARRFYKIIVPMQIDRANAMKLGSFVGVAAVAGACHHFKLGEETARS